MAATLCNEDATPMRGTSSNITNFHLRSTSTTTRKTMCGNSWAGAHFYTDGQRQSGNKSPKRACCLDFEIAAAATLRQSDILATAGGNIVAQSAGCERVFSEMGLVQTKYSSKLGLDKVRKTAPARMDIKRRHITGGHMHPRPHAPSEH